METLISMGFEATKVEIALNQCDQDMDAAMELLLAGCVEGDEFNSENSNFGSENSLQISIPEENIIELNVSQYSFEGIGNSACTSIVMTVGLNLLQILGKCLSLTKYKLEILRHLDLLNSAILIGIEEFHSIKEKKLHINGDHLSSDDVYDNSNLINNAFRSLTSTPISGILSSSGDSFHKFMNSIDDIPTTNNILVVLTKSPETIGIIIPSNRQSYILFDSHSRPQFGLNNAALLFFDNVSELCTYLNRLFICMTMHNDYSSLMYNSYEGNCFVLEEIEVCVPIIPVEKETDAYLSDERKSNDIGLTTDINSVKDNDVNRKDSEESLGNESNDNINRESTHSEEDWVVVEQQA